MPVIETGPGSASAAEWLLRHGARQLLCIPQGQSLPRQCIIQPSGEDARPAVMAVAASVLRHVPAEAALFGHALPAAAGPDKALYRQLLSELRDVTLGPLVSSAKVVPADGDSDAQLVQQLDALPGAMLVLGLSANDSIGRERVARFLEGPVARPVLFVRPFDAEAGLDA
jgi:hypothetical protein